METNTEQTRVQRQYPLASWLALKRDFVHGLDSLTRLCTKYNLPLGMCYEKSAVEGWSKLRTKYMNRKRRELELEAEQEPLMETKPEPVKGTGRLGEIENQLQLVDKLFLEAESSKDIAALAQAKEKLLNMWALLTGHPRPGTRRVSRSARPVSIPESDPVPSPVPTSDPTPNQV